LSSYRSYSDFDSELNINDQYQNQKKQNARTIVSRRT